MKCEVCHTGQRRERLIRYSIIVNDRLIVVDQVPAEVCDQCGETTFRSDIVKRLQKTVAHPGKPVRTLETPVYELA